MYTIPSIFIKIVDQNYNFEDLMMIDFQDHVFHVIDFSSETDITTFIKIDSNEDTMVKVNMDEMKNASWIILKESDWKSIDIDSIKELIKNIS